MECSYYSTPTFRRAISKLCKKERDGYHRCKKDICKVFKNLSFEDVWVEHFLIRDLNNIRIVKIRIANAFLNLSRSDGFRLIICCNRKYNSINFLNIYPKRGKQSQMDQSKEEYKRQLKEYGDCLKNGGLVRHDINDELKELDI